MRVIKRTTTMTEIMIQLNAKQAKAAAAPQYKFSLVYYPGADGTFKNSMPWVSQKDYDTLMLTAKDLL